MTFCQENQSQILVSPDFLTESFIDSLSFILESMLVNYQDDCYSSDVTKQTQEFYRKKGVYYEMATLRRSHRKIQPTQAWQRPDEIDETFMSGREVIDSTTPFPYRVVVSILSLSRNNLFCFVLHVQATWLIFTRSDKKIVTHISSSHKNAIYHARICAWNSIKICE